MERSSAGFQSSRYRSTLTVTGRLPGVYQYSVTNGATSGMHMVTDTLTIESMYAHALSYILCMHVSYMPWLFMACVYPQRMRRYSSQLCLCICLKQVLSQQLLLRHGSCILTWI